MEKGSKLKRNIVNIMVVALAAFLIILNSRVFAAAAEEEKTAKSTQAQNSNDENNLRNAMENVFRIETIYMDESGNSYPVKSGTGFLIGNTAKGQEQYIITTKTLVTVSDKKAAKIKKKAGIDKEEALEIHYRIVVSDDVAIEASVFNRAQDNDFAILIPEKTLADRDGISAGDSDLVKEKQAIFALGYDKVQNQVNLYSSHQEEIKKIKDTEYISFKAALTSIDYGGPLLDEEGYLLGMNVKAESEEEMGYALPVNLLKKFMDTLGIVYESADSQYGILLEKLEEVQKIAEDSKKYTTKTLNVLKTAADNAEEVLKNISASNEDYKEQVIALNEAQKQLKLKSTTYKIIIIVLGAIAVIIAFIVLALWILDKKKKEKIRYITDSQPARKEHKPAIDFDGTVAISTKIPTAFLVHKSNGEKVLIAKERFVIGSQSETVDFCIKNNRSISRNHAAILSENGVFFVKDLNSMNYTFVNNKQLSPNDKVVLRNGDIVRFANEEFIIEIKK